MPLPPVQQYGDTTRLEQLSSGLKRTGGTHGPVVQRTPAGRPEGSTTTPQKPQQVTGVGPDVQMAAKDVATAEWARQYWENLAAQFPSAWTQLYAQQADSVARAVQESYYRSTPNFED